MAVATVPLLAQDVKKSIKRSKATSEESNELAWTKPAKRSKKRKDSEDPESHDKDTDSERREAKRLRKEERRRKRESKRTAGSPNMSSLAVPFKLDPNALALPEAEAYFRENSITIHYSKRLPSFTPVTDFAQLGLDASIRPVLSQFSKPTPIQACSWPALLNKCDVIGIAETGSGKTLAFGIPALSHVWNEDDQLGMSSSIKVLVVSPTRELAIQSHETLTSLLKPFGKESVCLYGGVAKSEQIKSLRSPSVCVVVGTPGRLLDLCQEGTCDIKCVSYLVLDEADRMLDKGFENDMRQIIALTKDAPNRQTVMFSATWPESVKQLANSFLCDPVRIVVGGEELSANKKVEQVVEVMDDPRSKDARLSALLGGYRRNLKETQKGGQMSRILVFVLYKKEAARVEGTLKRNGFAVGGLHGDLSQERRLGALNDFKNGRTRLLVATDVAARGLDIPDVELVINYSFPLTIEDYIHRIGRTGRGGKEGKSITFFTGENHERGLAGELARVLRESGFECAELRRFPMTVKRKEHSAYGAFYREEAGSAPTATKIKF